MKMELTSDKSKGLPLRRYLRKRFKRKDFPVLNAPTTDTIETRVSGSRSVILVMIDFKFISFNMNESPSPSVSMETICIEKYEIMGTISAVN